MSSGGGICNLSQVLEPVWADSTPPAAAALWANGLPSPYQGACKGLHLNSEIYRLGLEQR